MVWRDFAHEQTHRDSLICSPVYTLRNLNILHTAIISYICTMYIIVQTWRQAHMTHRHTKDWQTGQADTKTDRQIERQKGRHTRSYRQTLRQTDRQAGRLHMPVWVTDRRTNGVKYCKCWMPTRAYYRTDDRLVRKIKHDCMLWQTLCKLWNTVSIQK